MNGRVPPFRSPMTRDWLRDSGRPFRGRAGETTGGSGWCQASSPVGGYTAGWSANCQGFWRMPISGAETLFPSSRSSAPIWRPRTTCSSERLIRRRSWRSCALGGMVIRGWRVPFRAFDELRNRWPAIEAAAQRNEPEARKSRAEEARASSEFAEKKALANERRRLRYPVPADALPPMGRPLMSHRGAIVIDDITGELVEAAVATAHYPCVRVRMPI